MIRNDTEYKEAVARLTEEKARLADHKDRLKQSGLSFEEITRVVDPIESFYLQLAEEVASYERLKRGEFAQLDNFEGLGNLLIALRISKGISQRDLAKRLGVHETQVSRDERNEYFGITVERANKIVEALGAHLKTSVEIPPDKKEEEQAYQHA
jgi:DNA-binding Xre family transcriptional regulator